MTVTRVALGADHRGVDMKARIAEHLRRSGIEPVDVGTHSTESCDYPDYAHRVACEVATGAADRGILICGSGIGMAMAANRHPEIRAALVHDRESAELSRRHNDANVLCLASDVLAKRTADEPTAIVDIWLKTDFEGGRHQRRVEKISLSPESRCHE